MLTNVPKEAEGIHVVVKVDIIDVSDWLEDPRSLTGVSKVSICKILIQASELLLELADIIADFIKRQHVAFTGTT